MTPLAHLLLAACALAAPLHARAASIPETPELQKKIPAVVLEDIKQSSPVDPPHELAVPNEPVKEIGNELRVKPADDIPVAVVIEAVEPSQKINEVGEDDDVKRPQVDLRNPGPPQRQEHETQNPERHSDELLKVSTIKDNIEQTQILLKKSFQGVTDDIVNWVNIEDQDKIQQNIQNLRDTFTAQIQKLNDTIQALAEPETAKPADDKEPKRDFKKIESHLKTLEDNFNNEVETLSVGVGLVGSLKSANAADADDMGRDDAPEAPAPPALPVVPAAPAVPVVPVAPAPPAQPAPSPPPNFINQMMQTIYNGTIDRLQSLQELLTPTATSTPPVGVQADQPEGTTTRPSFLEQVSGLFNFNNFQIGSNGTGFLSQFPNFQLPNNPPQWPSFNLLNRPGSTTAKPAAAAAVPEKPEAPKPEHSEKPADAPAAPPAAQPAAQAEGPIRQFLNPIAQGISSTVQRIQNTISNRDTPREPAQKNDNLSTKGGWYGRPGRPGGSGDNNDSNGVSEQKSEEIKELVQEEPVKEAEDDKEVKPEAQEKTE